MLKINKNGDFVWEMAVHTGGTCILRGALLCTSLQYARVFTYKIIVFENSPNHEIYVKNNENLELGYEKSV